MSSQLLTAWMGTEEIVYGIVAIWEDTQKRNLEKYQAVHSRTDTDNETQCRPIKYIPEATHFVPGDVG